VIAQKETFYYDALDRLEITYSTDQQRWKTVLKKNGNVVKTIYFADNYEMITENGVTRIFVSTHKKLRKGLFCFHHDTVCT
jgi:hypothetical protein